MYWNKNLWYCIVYEYIVIYVEYIFYFIVLRVDSIYYIIIDKNFIFYKILEMIN